ncbi:hypothetical protein [Xanthobacter pseudotagetidis]|uniref:hypothetical protein n=1 Tax=Xanthobacter pseudotagetidis TaxID=3119911 RepID=UPI003729C995
MLVTGNELVCLYHAERVNDLIPHGKPMKLRKAIEEALSWAGVDRIRAHISFVEADIMDLCGIGEIEDCAHFLGLVPQPPRIR